MVECPGHFIGIGRGVDGGRQRPAQPGQRPGRNTGQRDDSKPGVGTSSIEKAPDSTRVSTSGSCGRRAAVLTEKARRRQLWISGSVVEEEMKEKPMRTDEEISHLRIRPLVGNVQHLHFGGGSHQRGGQMRQ